MRNKEHKEDSVYYKNPKTMTDKELEFALRVVLKRIETSQKRYKKLSLEYARRVFVNKVCEK
jgi:hypothetical protein